jgi:hypothetical protein
LNKNRLIEINKLIEISSFVYKKTISTWISLYSMMY